jgi:hypothetical protein
MLPALQSCITSFPIHSRGFAQCATSLHCPSFSKHIVSIAAAAAATKTQVSRGWGGRTVYSDIPVIARNSRMACFQAFFFIAFLSKALLKRGGVVLRAREWPRTGLMCSDSASLTFQALAPGMNFRIVILVRWCGLSVSWIVLRLVCGGILRRLHLRRLPLCRLPLRRLPLRRLLHLRSPLSGAPPSCSGPSWRGDGCASS